MTRSELAILAAVLLVLLLAATGFGQATRPTADRDWIGVYPQSGPVQWFGPADATFRPQNVPVTGIRVGREGGTWGDWVRYQVPAPATQPTPRPATLPATLPVVVPPADPNVTDVPAGGDWVAAVRAAVAKRKAGAPVQTVRLAPGVWSDPLTDTGILLNGVDIRGAGIGKTVVRVREGSAVRLWCPTDVTIAGIYFAADAPTDAGIRINGGVGVTVEDCEATGFEKGFVSEVAQGGTAKRLGKNLRLVRSKFNGNYSTVGKPGCGVFCSDTHGIVIDGCEASGNGWKPGVFAGDERSHGIYITGDCSGLRIVHGTFADNSSHGVQARCGGDVTDNLFARNPIGLSFGLVNGDGVIFPGGVSGTVARNAFVGTRPLAGAERGWAVEFGDNVLSADVTDNLLWSDHRLQGSRGLVVAPFKVDVGVLSAKSPDKGKPTAGVKRLKFDGNAVQWPSNTGGRLWVNPSLARQTRSAGGVIPQARWDAPAAAAVADARARAGANR